MDGELVDPEARFGACDPVDVDQSGHVTRAAAPGILFLGFLIILCLGEAEAFVRETTTRKQEEAATCVVTVRNFGNNKGR